MELRTISKDNIFLPVGGRRVEKRISRLFSANGKETNKQKETVEA